MNYLRIIGDVHGKMTSYIKLANKAEYSIQIGDMGFRYNRLSELDPNHHLFFGGNHDNYDEYHNCPYSLGDYGARMVGGLNFFFFRGAFSIDFRHRRVLYANTGKKTWWEEEEMSSAMMHEALLAYEMHKPKIVLSHDCPSFVAKKIGKPYALKSFGFDPDKFRTNTQSMLEAAYEIHKPDMWIFGHFHNNWVEEIDDTTFICLDELECLEISKRGNWNLQGAKGNVKVIV